jgi:hypothetical protein
MPNRKISQPYTCPSCKYETIHKNDIRRHFYQKQKPCPCLTGVFLTDIIREHVLQNRIYNPQPIIQSQPSKTYVKYQESYYQDILEKYLGGTHMRLPSGETDITTTKLHAEIKNIASWRKGMMQLFLYNSSEPRQELHLYVFGTKGTEADAKCYRKIVQLCNNTAIRPFHLRVLGKDIEIYSILEEKIITTLNLPA